MARRDSTVDTVGSYVDVQYSSGDNNKMNTIQLYKEENNNEINELSKELSEMGCIVDAVKRPPNICVENCVYKGPESDDDAKSQSNANENGEDAYSDEFEDDKSDAEEELQQLERNNANDVDKNKESNINSKVPPVKLSKSMASMSSNKIASVSGRSTSYGSVSVPKTRRVNMSFPNERLRDIERHNHILLNKILSARNSNKSSVPTRADKTLRKPIPAPAATQRKKQQRQIDHDNLILLKKIQSAKSSSYSIRR